MTSSFNIDLITEIEKSRNNHYGKENFDELRFGNYSQIYDYKLSIKQFLKKLIKYFLNQDESIEVIEFLNTYGERLQRIWHHLDDDDRSLLTSLITYRLLGRKKIKLPRNNQEYWHALSMAKSLKVEGETYDPHFMHFVLEKFDLKKIGYEISLFFSDLGIAIDFILEQYAYKRDGKSIIQVEKGDIVLDVGGCWGDTALYFASKAGNEGRVYSFEFIPDNIKLFMINLRLNPVLEKRIRLINNPVSNQSNTKIYYKDFGPGSRVEMTPFGGQTGEALTVSIDDMVKLHNIQKVDFIKMDIEGAEPMALEGSIETIKNFKPKLAIATYHSMDDFVNIPNWILDLNLGYEIFLSHSTIHSEETVCFARVRE